MKFSSSIVADAENVFIKNNISEKMLTKVILLKALFKEEIKHMSIMVDYLSFFISSHWRSSVNRQRI